MKPRYVLLAVALFVFQPATTDGQRWWRHVQFLADDALQGRNVGSPGFEKAAEYVEQQFKEIGLKPGGTDGYRQPVQFEARTLVPEQSSLTLVREGREEPLVPREDATMNARGELNGSIDAPMVFVGYGLSIPGANWDDLAGLDLHGKIAVYVTAPVPAAVSDNVRSHVSSTGERWAVLRKAGAIGIATLPAGAAPQGRGNQPTRPGAAPGAPAAGAGRGSGAPPPQPVVVLADRDLQDTAGEQVSLSVTRQGAEKLLAGSGHTLDEIADLVREKKPLPRFALPGTLRVHATLKTEPLESANIVGVFEGADPQLKSEYVVMSAHLDHVGVGRPINGDSIYNGAMDDASGVASVIEIARHLKESGAETKRSIVFMTVTAEEKGELGSKYFAAHPTVPFDNIVADINLDMFLPLYPLKVIEVQGLTESSLGGTVREAAKTEGVDVQTDREPEQNRFIRSDQYSFIRRGIPSLAFKFGYEFGSPDEKTRREWVRDVYHKPNDDLKQPVDVDAAAKFDRVIMGLLQRVANDPSRPTWNADSFFKRFSSPPHSDAAPRVGSAWTNTAVQRDQSRPIVPPVITAAEGSGVVEQTQQGARGGPVLVASFDGMGATFSGPQGQFRGNNPSDNSLAVGPNHIVQIVNSRTAIFTKKGKKFNETGRVLYGPVPTNNFFKGFGGSCETTNNGDAVARYDQLADRWLIVMPIFRRAEARPDQPAIWKDGDESAHVSPPGRPGQPGAAAALFQPPPPPPSDPNAPPEQGRGRGRGAAGERPPQPQGPYAMCYAVSASSDPMGSYYRYEFLRPLFPDYPRPAIWPDGYYTPTSTSDNRISETVFSQKHACVADRRKMLLGQDATEQCLMVENVNFFNTSDLDGRKLPPPGAPNILMAAGGLQLDKKFEDDSISAWQFHVDWNDPSKTKITGPQKISVAPYHYLCDGQLTNCVPQPGTDRRLDSQGDKIMARLTYRNVNGHESVVAVHSINTTSGGGGVRWYEFRVNPDRTLKLYQQGTYMSDGNFRWLPSAAMDKRGNIGIGYSYGGATTPAGQRFAGRLASDPPGKLTLHETVLAEGKGFQTGMRWEDYSQTAVDPDDDCTIWYVGDYIKEGQTTYSSRIGAFRMPGCR